MVLCRWPRKHTASLFALAVLFYAPAASAAWTQPKGHWFTSQQWVYFSTDTFVDDNGHKLKQPEFRKYEWNSYGEYGLTDDTTLGINLFLQHIENDYTFFSGGSPVLQEGTRSNDGLADSEFFLRHKIVERKVLGEEFLVSFQPLVKLPSWYHDGQPPQSGTDDFDAEFMVQVATKKIKGRFNQFSKWEAGYRKRFGEWRDQWKASGTWGVDLGSGFLFMPQTFITYRAGGTGISTPTLASANDYDLIKAQLSFVYECDDTTELQIGVYKHVYARNTSEGEGLVFGLWKRF